MDIRAVWLKIVILVGNKGRLVGNGGILVGNKGRLVRNSVIPVGNMGRLVGKGGNSVKMVELRY